MDEEDIGAAIHLYDQNEDKDPKKPPKTKAVAASTAASDGDTPMVDAPEASGTKDADTPMVEASTPSAPKDDKSWIVAASGNFLDRSTKLQRETACMFTFCVGFLYVSTALTCTESAQIMTNIRTSLTYCST